MKIYHYVNLGILENIKINLDGYFSSNVDMLREIKSLITLELWGTLFTCCLCFSPFLEFYNIIILAFSQANKSLHALKFFLENATVCLQLFHQTKKVGIKL